MLQPVEIFRPVLIANASFITIAAIPSLQDRCDESAIELPDVRESRVGRMRHCIGDKLLEFGMGDELACQIEYQGNSTRAGPLRIDEITEAIELEIGGDDATGHPAQRRTRRNYQFRHGEGIVGWRNEQV